MSPERWIYTIPLRLRSLFHRKRVEQELDEELRDHLDHKTQQVVTGGTVPNEARYAALRSMGAIEQFKEECRDTRRVNVIENLFRDLLYGLRALRKNPRFTVIALLTLALGIGANTAVFSMVNALLFHPYPFHGLDRLVRVWETRRGIDEGIDFRFLAAGNVNDFATAPQIVDGLTVYRYQEFNLSAQGNTEPVLGCSVSSNFFDVLGVAPGQGRVFAVSEEIPGNDLVVILSNAFWQRQLGGDPTALSKPLRLNGRYYTVIGIMPQDFDYPVPAQLWTPLALSPADKIDRAKFSLEALGRLKPGISVQEARSALQSVALNLEKQYPNTNSGRGATLLELRKELYSFTLPLFALLQAAAIFVLLLACANLASLLFARLLGREKETAVRTALGANRRRLAQLFVCEMLVLSLAAGAIATIASIWSVRALRTSIPAGWTEWVPGWSGIHVSMAVLAFTMLIAFLVGIGCGLASILHLGRVDVNKLLKEAGPRSMTRGRARLRSVLVVAQVVFAMVLLVCGGLTVQGFLRLSKMYQGLEPAGLLRVEISLPKDAYSENAKIISFYDGLLRESSSLSGVSTVAISSNLPASNVDNPPIFFTIEGRAALRAADSPSSEIQIVSPDYFRAMRMNIFAGRAFSEIDSANGGRVAVISRTMAERNWPVGGALGQRFKLGPPDSTAPWVTIVGIADDVRQNWWNPPARPVIYEPFLQSPKQSMDFVLRTASTPASFATFVRSIVRRLDPEVALGNINTYDNEVSSSIAIVRIMGILLAVFGGVALTLSSIGVYGVMSESVAQRTREIGIRIALGANPSTVMRLVLLQAIRLVAIGLVIALPLAFLATRTMSKLMFGVISADQWVLAAIAILMVVAAMAAGYFPARRAMRVDPIIALRYE
jgi:putative ABC transport system permease protein